MSYGATGRPCVFSRKLGCVAGPLTAINGTFLKNMASVIPFVLSMSIRKILTSLPQLADRCASWGRERGGTWLVEVVSCPCDGLEYIVARYSGKMRGWAD
jgi:hypothetical protein